MVSRSSLRSPNVQSGVQNRKVRLVQRASSRITTRTHSQNALNAAPTIKKSSTKVKVMATDKGVTATIKKVSKRSKEFAHGRGHLLHVEEDKMEVMKEEGRAPAIVSKAAAPKQQTVEVVAEAQMLAEGAEAQRVKEALREFNTLYLEAIQEEDKRAAAAAAAATKKEVGKRPSKRPDLKAITKMNNLNLSVNSGKIIGAVPGVHVGQQFLSRAEMVIIGLHQHWLNGINYIGATKSARNEFSHLQLPIAVSIVMSGGYEDDVDNSDDLIYTGQGGNNLTGDRRQIKDQEMTKGNLALVHSMEFQTPVRVVRGHANKLSYTGKLYTYDGIYQVYDHWTEKGISGFRVFKYKLRRLPGQPDLTTQQVFFARGKLIDSAAELEGLVSKDISDGMERIPVVASNTVDDNPCPPTDYTYMTASKLSPDIPKRKPAKGCSCKGVCTDTEKCSCARLNGNVIPYVHNHGGRLIKAMDVVYECGPNCSCGPECVNRTSQNGLQYRLEVFKTTNKGWGVRSWDYIPAGAPICEYVGTIRHNDDRLESMLDNMYIFELDMLQTMWGMEGRQRRGEKVIPPLDGGPDIDQTSEGHSPLFVLDAGKGGNVSRFLNHSCEPNVFIQCMLSDHHDVTMPRIVMCAAENIHPMQELCYDYGYALNSVVAADGTVKEVPCYCGSLICRKRMY
ncbi:hypothetical protein BDL97_17G003600 [Sphagnum fallax]|nr:hypothetical protein BDL97_17G003600 [Sphagnum fallax]